MLRTGENRFIQFKYLMSSIQNSIKFNKLIGYEYLETNFPSEPSHMFDFLSIYFLMEVKSKNCLMNGRRSKIT